MYNIYILDLKNLQVQFASTFCTELEKVAQDFIIEKQGKTIDFYTEPETQGYFLKENGNDCLDVYQKKLIIIPGYIWGNSCHSTIEKMYTIGKTEKEHYVIDKPLIKSKPQKIPKNVHFEELCERVEQQRQKVDLDIEKQDLGTYIKKELEKPICKLHSDQINPIIFWKKRVENVNAL